MLKKRLFSCPAAFATTLEQHEQSLLHGHGAPGAQSARRSASSSGRSTGMEEDYADDEEYDEATDDAVDTASRLFSEPSRRGTGPAQADEGVGEPGVGATRLARRRS